ncbi:MAG: zinc-ribbon domain-containing protein, partial [Anaerolineae bacterium]|nr:zinc-ribbon domain-containing protein [Anaerolineae bacterium]
MIRCPKCGTLNKDGSRFCNECGAPLQRTSIRCPMCGALNPAGNVFCDRCHARLIPMEGVVPPEGPAKPQEETTPRVQGISLPTRTSAKPAEQGSESEAFPNWLQGLVEASAPQGDKESTIETPEPEETPEYPDWLSGLLPEEPESKIADSGAPTGAAAEPLPDWILNAPPSEPSTPEEATEPSEEPESQQLPDWFAGLTEEPLIEEPTDSTEEIIPPFEADYAGIESLEWLSGLTEETGEATSASETEAEGEESFPDWLSGQTEGSIEEEKEISGETAGSLGEESPALPEWLSRLAVAAPVEVASTTFETAAPDRGLPDWLASMATETPPEETYEPGEYSAEPPAWLYNTPEQEPEEALPDWLAAGEPMKEAPLAAEAEALAEEEPAAWLRETPEGKFSGAEPPVQPGETEGLPDWLSGLGSEEPEETEATLPASEQPAAEGLPDWLSGLGGEETEETEATLPAAEQPAAEGLPDWLSLGEPSQAEKPGKEITPFTEADEEQADLPDWLKSLAPEAEQPKPVSPFMGLQEAEAPALQEEQAAQPSEQELPDWLASLGGTPPPSSAVSPFAEAPLEAAGSELPDWLTETGAESIPGKGTIFTESIEAPEPAEEDFGAAPEVAPPLQAASHPMEEPELPEKELEEEELLATPLEAALTAKSKATKEVEVPEWLKDLGSGSGEAEAVPEGLEQASVPS